MFDGNKDGRITSVELRQIIDTLELKLDSQELDAMVDEIDTDGIKAW